MIYIDLLQLTNHLEILREELQRSVQLSEALQGWYQTEQQTLGISNRQLVEQISFADGLTARIRQRISILESAITTFSAVKSQTERELEDALRSLDC